MIFNVDTTSSMPVYAQIVEQIKRAVACGALRGGDPLPSLRELAVELRVNPLTVSKAYKLLEGEGLIETRHGLGSFVTARTEGAAEDYRREFLTRRIDDLLRDAENLGVDKADIVRLLKDRMEASDE